MHERLCRDDLAVSGAGAGSVRMKLSAVVKDVIDLAGEVTGAGNPAWAATHDPAARDAACVASLRAAGIDIAGKATCAEFAFSLSGDNAHFGMPLNAAAPDRNPGGSSSGSAAAVAAKRCNIGVGTDTLGSVRIPASYCGLFGYRPTYGLVDTTGVLHLARSFDTVGLLTASGSVLEAAATALAGGGLPRAPVVRRVRRVVDAFALAEAAVRPALAAALSAVVEAVGGESESVAAFGEESGFTHALDVFSTVQGFEVWQQFGDWIQTHDPDFGPGVAERFSRAASITPDAYAAAVRACETLRAHVLGLLEEDAVLALPTTGGLAPLRSAGADELQRVRVQSGRLSCLASLAGCPSISLPAAPVGGAPVGLALVAAPGADCRLLALAARWLRP
jgi:amidase